MLGYTDPKTNDLLELQGEYFVNPKNKAIIGKIEQGIPRFVDPEDNYAESFGYQWKKWHSIRSDIRNPGHNLENIIMGRTHFDEFDLRGKTVLECGMGGGDDTEVLLSLPFAEIHSFDLSTAVERAREHLADKRLRIFQASILDIPYPDYSFDLVFCHRVLQHTPDPEKALRKVCAKVKKGGILFAHSYKRSKKYMSEWRYKYRWFTKRLPWRVIAAYVDNFGYYMHYLNKVLYRNPLTGNIAYRFIPFFNLPTKGEGSATSKASIIELERQITFDALTPWHDHPMLENDFRAIIESAGFEILHFSSHKVSPMFCTAIRKKLNS